MFARFTSLLSVAALVAVVAAAPRPVARAGECSTGPVQCCNSVQHSSSSTITSITGLLGIVIDAGDSLVGLGCSPIAGNSGCTQQPVCCNDNNYNGLINIGCSPITIL